MPATVAMALRADGWVLRSAPPWLKRNSMPKSAKGRPASAVEYIYFLAKVNDAQYWMHRDGRGARTQPEPDYRYVLRETVRHLLGYTLDGRPRYKREKVDRAEVLTPPAGWHPKRKGCCADNPKGEAEEEEEDEDEKESGPKGIHRWRRINLWEGHDYYYDDEAVRIQMSPETVPRMKRGVSKKHKNIDGAPGQTPHSLATPREHGEGYGDLQATGRARRNSDWYFESWQGLYQVGDELVGMIVNPEAYPDSHFATFPRKLVEPLIKAATSQKGACATCGAAWGRVVSTTQIPKARNVSPEKYSGGEDGEVAGRWTAATDLQTWKESRTLAFAPTCSCYADPCAECGKPWKEVRVKRQVSTMNIRVRDAKKGRLGEKSGLHGLKADATEGEITAYGDESYAEREEAVRVPSCSCGVVPCVVLDPFGGSGTVGQVARELGRSAVLCEAKAEYVRMIRERVDEVKGMSVKDVASLEEFG